MKNAVVPVLSPADLPYLPALAAFLRANKPARLYILVNPHIGTKAGEVEGRFNAEIQTLEQFKMDAATRNDTQAFANYVGQIEAKKLERDKVLRESWKEVPKEELQKSVENSIQLILNGDVAGAVRYVVLTEVQEPADFYFALHKMRGSWPKEIPQTACAVLWPRAFDAIQSAGQKNTQLPVNSPKTPQAAKVTGPTIDAKTNPAARREQLFASKFMGIKAAARRLGIPFKDRKTDDIVTDIIAKESVAA